MRNVRLIKILLLIFMVGCIEPVFAQKRSEKRGIGENTFNYEEEIISLSPGVSWYYNWGSKPEYMLTEVLGPNKLMDFYPMAWNDRFNEEEIRAYLTENPGVKYLLGFNEPNFKKQANMTPAEAVAVWPRLEKIAQDFGLELVGPALNYSPDKPYTEPADWYDEFFELLPEGSQVDYLALHCYMIGSEGMMDFVDRIAERYGKKIWLTEFCAWDNLTENPQQALTIQKDQMVRKVEDLELSPNVYKYAWFKAKDADQYPYYRLLQYRNVSQNIPAGTLTELGEIYVYMSSFDLDHYYQVEEIIPATDYVKSAYTNVEKNTDTESPCRLQIGSFGVSRSVDYLIDIEEDGEYYLHLRMASEESFFHPKIGVYVDGEAIALQEIPATGSVERWKTNGIPVSLSAGQQRITLKSEENTTCKLNWIKISKEKPNGVSNSFLEKESVFIERLDSEMNIISEIPVKEVMIMDMSGRRVKRGMSGKQISISDISEGVYLISILLENGEKVIEKYIIK